MFQLVTVSDVIQIQPHDFDKPSIQAIRDSIAEKYENKVVLHVGLCLGMGDIISTSEGLIGHGTGIANVNITFRLVVFRPFKGEVIEVILMGSTPDGVHCALNSIQAGPSFSIASLDFFNDIWIPKENLPEGCSFHDEERVWQWQQDGADFFFDKGERARIRVEEEVWTDQSPDKPVPEAQAQEREKTAPYRIIGSMSLPGLGPVNWWDEEQPDATAVE